MGETVSSKAKNLMERYFANAGKEAALDEIFIGSQPLLTSVCPKSLAFLWGLLAKDRKSTTCEEFLKKSPDLKLAASDMGSGLVKGIEQASLVHQADLFHLKNLCNKAITSFENYCYRLIEEEDKAKNKLEKKKLTGKPVHKEARAYKKAKDKTTKEIERFDLAEPTIKKKLYPAFEIIDKDGSINTYHKAKDCIDGYVNTLKGLKFKKVKSIISYLKNDKIKSEVVNILNAILRGSSAVECVNSIIRPYQQIKKRFSESFIYLVALYHNLHTFVKGSRREGKSPAQILGVKLPTHDFFGLLKTV